MSEVDARGLSCPQPVMLLKKALSASPASCTILVDNPTARENVMKFGRKAGYAVSEQKSEGEYRITFTKA